ncbi:hypothetical protein L6164_015069 [Bauhinia variegata]|uniref:Uncharacterized protein n=1 Tax=Bauhinia variegata TaxID=167791 RepID=A0ACB9NN40_BAUVA|nr:hypothetical protein L6164_015069 [Bauhinia variegata]
MKLLGWMHRKFRQNSAEPLKDLVIGQPALDDQQIYQKTNHGTRHFKQAQRDHNLRKSFAGLEAARVEDDDYEEESSAAMSELFHGFLAIGTLGSEQAITDPSTPTFAISLENITEKESEVTENDLKLINDELEKVLGAETKDDDCIDSSGRNSHGYLFGSAIELSETTTVAKKEHRTSLGELFQRSKLAEENSGSKCEREDKRTEREPDKSAMHLMKKKLKKKMLHASSRSSTSGGGTVDSASAETKLHKILHMFHRKVHPENSAATQNSVKHQKNENKKKIVNDGGHIKGDLTHPEEDIISHPKKALSKESLRHYKSQSNPLQITLDSGDSFGNREHWIKTDADYLVLEL